MVAVLGMCIKLQTGKKLVNTDRGVTSLTDEVLTVSLKVKHRVIEHCPYDTNSGHSFMFIIKHRCTGSLQNVMDAHTFGDIPMNHSI